jgi:dTDP-4-amino-4,6-dideoxygalactose transaminase
MWSRLQIDISWSDLIAAACACGVKSGRARLEGQCVRQWTDADDVIICSSVRSGFDLLLQAMSLPAGSEALFTALTVPDMARIVQEHGLVAVPVDLADQGFAPCVESLRRAIGPATRILVVAHLFGVRTDLGPLVDAAKEHGLLLVEDCAQVFSGSDYRGHPDADVSMFSFGPIKTATALGGGVVRVRNRKLLETMRGLQSQYPTLRRWSYLKRVAKYAVLKAISGPRAFGLVTHCATAAGLDFDTALNSAARNYSESELLVQLRRRPSTPLLAMLLRRWRKYDWRRLRVRKAKGRLFEDMISGPKRDCESDETARDSDSYWVFPVMSSDPKLVSDLRRAGFDATSNCRLAVIDAPAGREQLAPHNARATMSRLVFLPLYPELPDDALAKMATIVKGRVTMPDRLGQTPQQSAAGGRSRPEPSARSADVGGMTQG